MKSRMRHRVYIANLLFSLAYAATLYTNSSFIERTVGLKFVGVLYAIAALGSIFVLSCSGKTMTRVGNRVFFLSYGALYSVSLLLLVFPVSTPILIAAFVIYLFTSNILVFSLNIFFQHLTEIRGRGKMRGFFLLLGSVGIMLGPLFASRVIDFGGYIATYAFGLGIFAILAVLVESSFRKYADSEYNFGKVETAIRHTIKQKTLRNVIAANFILQFFYAWMVVYTPIYLSQYLGFSWDSIGIMFSIMLLAFVILDYPLGRLADWLGSEKELAAIGFLIMIGTVFALAFLRIDTVIMMGALLFMSRIGAATVEAMTEIHFFKSASETDPGLLSLFCDLRPLAFAIGPLLGMVALYFLPFKMIFAVLGAILFLGLTAALSMEKKPGWWVREHKN